MKNIAHKIIKIPAFRVLFPAVAGFLFYGTWAFGANFGHGHVAAIKAACTQGSYSFTITLVLALVIEWLHRVLQRLPHHSWLVGFIACLALYFTSWSVNVVTGTPNILLTILPGAVISTIYTISYIVALNKLKTK